MSVIKNFEEYESKTQKAAGLFNDKKYKQALTGFIELAEYNQNNFKVHETLSIIYLKLDDLENAQKEYDIAAGLLKQKGLDISRPRPFEEIVKELESVDILEAKYRKEDEVDKNSLLPIQISLHYMAKGEYQKAVEFLTDHKEKYFVTP